MTRVVCKQAGALILLSFVLAGCAGSVRYSDGPDEFQVLPSKPLQTPADLTALPDPTPGGANLVDDTPKADAAAALGGRRSAVVLVGLPAVDGALVSYASRYGVDPGIREALSRKARKGRKDRRGFFLFRWLSGGLFGGQVLAPYAETQRLRAAGVKTPSAPPAR